MIGSNALDRMVGGALAGAAGSAVLNTVTYVDMLVPGRGASSVPEQDVEQLEELVSLDPPTDEAARGVRSNRATAAGALLGYLVGLGVGADTRAAWPRLRAVPLPVAGLVVGGAAMACSDIPSVALGTTDPREWSAASWAADVVPHIAYGLMTVVGVRSLLAR